MKNFLFLVLAALASACLLGYNLKATDSKILTPECYVSCFTADVREQFKDEASTMAFANMHETPLGFKMGKEKGKMISIKSTDGKDAWAYEIKSKKKSNNYILVIQEWWGLNDYIKVEAQNLSKDLSNANILALDLYDGKVAATPDSAMKLVQAVKTDRLENIIKAAIAYAGPDAKIFTVGWCFGGMWSLQASILAAKQGAGCAMYYGRPETNIEKLKKLNGDVIGFFGNLDKSPSPVMVNAFEQNMKTAGKILIANKYEAGHGFANPSNPSFNKEAREDAYKKTITFFKSRM
jgi:carboxymethylenebutenolidase